MRHLFSVRNIWLPILAILMFGVVMVSTPSYFTAQEMQNCQPPTINTNNWSTDFCKAEVDFSEIRSGGPPKDGIPALTNPNMESIVDASQWLSDRSPVIAVEIDGQARAYPQAILIWHEIANDELAGVPIAVTFCPLCNSSITYDRRVDGEVLDFGVSGLLRNSDMVMFDRQTETWWQQLTGEGLVGAYTDVVLEFVPSQVISFGVFAERYQDGLVMSRDTGFNRQYGGNPYTNYDSRQGRPFLFDGAIDERLDSPVEHVLATEIGDVPIAYPLNLIRKAGVINDVVGETAIVIFFQSGMASALDDAVIDNSYDLGMAGMYESTVDNQVLTFIANEDGTFTDDQTGSTWNAFGEASAGELAGTELQWIHAFPHFWFAWAAFHPDTEVYSAK